MHIFVNALAASAGGGVTYVRNVVRHFSESGVQTTFLLTPSLRAKLSDWPNVAFIEESGASNIARRFRYEQTVVPSLIEKYGADVLLSAGNFALRRSPVPQILLSRNSLYTSADFFRDLWERKEYKTWTDTHIRGLFAKRSMGWADLTVAPSAAFAEELREWSGKSVLAIHHGFDRPAFFDNQTSLPEQAAKQLSDAEDSVRLLHVSHYNYYRNFETVFRALPILRAQPGHRKFKLILTCALRGGQNPGDYRAEKAAALIREFGLEENVVELGTIPYECLHRVYAACDVYVTAAYAESFAHPLVEAMASRLPVVASDIPVHREICGNACLYFPRFSSEDLAKRVLELTSSSDLPGKLEESGDLRSQDFSWKRHVEQIIELANQLTGKAPNSATISARF